MPANTGEATRPGRAPPYPCSVPDVTLHHVRWAGRVQWTPLDALSSDHRPILIEVQVGRWRHKRKPKPPYSYRKANWNLFTEKMVEGINNLTAWTDGTKIGDATAAFTKVVTEAAIASIPRGSRIAPKPWWTPEVEAAVRRRNRLRARSRSDPTKAQAEAWTRADQEVRTLILDARRASWREFASGLNMRTDAMKVWATIRTLAGREAHTRQTPVDVRTVTRAVAKAARSARQYQWPLDDWYRSI